MYGSCCHVSKSIPIYLLINYKNFSLPKIFFCRIYSASEIGIGAAGIRISVCLKLGEEKNKIEYFLGFPIQNFLLPFLSSHGSLA